MTAWKASWRGSSQPTRMTSRAAISFVWSGNCRGFCPRSSGPDVAVCLASTMVLDTVLWQMLGSGDRPRASLFDLAGCRSPIARAQQNILTLLCTWSAPDSGWELFRCTGGDFDDREQQLFAKSQLLQASAGLFEYFEARMCHPPYSLVQLADGSVSSHMKKRIAEDFLRRPLGCLSLFCRNLRADFPTVSSLLQGGAAIVGVWSKTAYVSIDLCERFHAHMRLDLRSDTRARSFTRSSNRSFCEQVKAEHIRRGGLDPGCMTLRQLIGEDLATALKGVGRSKKEGGSPGASGSGGNPRMAWRNHALAAFKQQIAPDRKLTPEELQQFEAESRRKWQKMATPEVAAWRSVSEGQRLERSLGASPPLPLADRETPFEPWCAAGTRELPVHLSDLKAIFTSMDAEVVECLKQNYNDKSLLVGTAIPRASALPADPHCHHGILGCFALKKNVCRFALRPDHTARLDGLCRTLCAFVDTKGKVEIGKAESLLCFRGAGPDGLRRDMCALLVSAVYSPKMQFLARCSIYSSDGTGKEVHALPGGFPFTVSLRVRKSRLGGSLESVSVCTSDEFCLELVRANLDWQLCELSWQPGARPLLDHQVTGVMAPFVAGGRASSSRTVVEVPDWALGDPIARGMAMGSAGLPPLQTELTADDAAQHHDVGGGSEEGDFEGGNDEIDFVAWPARGCADGCGRWLARRPR